MVLRLGEFFGGLSLISSIYSILLSEGTRLVLGQLMKNFISLGLPTLAHR